MNAKEKSTSAKPARSKARQLTYPEHTVGSKVAASIRNKANGLTAPEKTQYFRKGMSIIYGGTGAKETVRAGH
jgi:hypothetical protein